MTAKEKAVELIDKFMRWVPAEEEYEYPYAKQCAILSVDETLKALRGVCAETLNHQKYWQLVKEEINNL